MAIGRIEKSVSTRLPGARKLLCLAAMTTLSTALTAPFRIRVGIAV